MGVRKDFHVNEMWNISKIYHVYYKDGIEVYVCAAVAHFFPNILDIMVLENIKMF
jgi:predicted peroxiredoxin